MDIENKVIVYKNRTIKQSEMLKSSTGALKIQSTDMSGERNQSMFHEEYALNAAREQFKLDTQAFLRNTLLQDIKKARDLHLQKIEQRQLFSQHCENMLEGLYKRRKKFDENAQIFLARSQQEIKKLNEECRCISVEAVQARETIKALYSFDQSEINID